MAAIDWHLSSTIASALATVALTFFAGVELWRERKRSQREEQAASAKGSAIAFLLRRQLLSWVAKDATTEQLETWLRASARSGALAQHFDIAERRFESLLATLGEGPSASAARARKAFVLFLAGTGRLNQYLSTPRPQGVELFDWIRLLEDAAKDLRGSIDELETGPIGADLLNEAAILERLRDQEDPFNQLAEALRQDALNRGLLPPG